MNIENEVLPCPFCGSSDISDGEVLTEYPSGRVTKQSMCRDCMALGAEAVLDKDEIDYGSVKAIAAWNKRQQLAQQPSVDVLVEALRDAFEQIEEFKGKWWQVPSFGNKINKVTRESICAAHNHIFIAHNNIQNTLDTIDKAMNEAKTEKDKK